MAVGRSYSFYQMHVIPMIGLVLTNKELSNHNNDQHDGLGAKDKISIKGELSGAMLGRRCMILRANQSYWTNLTHVAVLSCNVHASQVLGKRGATIYDTLPQPFQVDESAFVKGNINGSRNSICLSA